MKIGQFARQAGVNIDTIRYYERHGLLPPPERLRSGYRVYGDADVQRLRFVKRAKALGFSLDEIGELLTLSARREHDMGDMKSIASARLIDVDAKMAELARIRDGLRELIDACPGHGALRECPIQRALSGESL